MITITIYLKFSLSLRFFMQVPTQELYRDLIVGVHGAVNAEFPFRYKRFIQRAISTARVVRWCRPRPSTSRSCWHAPEWG